FNEFFTRALKPQARTIDNTPAGICSPVDGCVSQIGPINTGQIFQAKGFSYRALDLLGGRPADAEPFSNGVFATLYLSPRDYHRIHMPVDATLKSMHYVPGRLFSVAPHTVRTVPRLFARNERVVALFDSSAGKLAMVLVGAINVAAIETVWAGLITPPAGSHIKHCDYSTEQQIKLVKGQEMGRFNMGSTVILLAEHGSIWQDSLREGSTVRMGELIGKHQ
ncbi:MAG: archaetidylserine decarboxylase, partial [Pseudomonadota bacterium]